LVNSKRERKSVLDLTLTVSVTRFKGSGKEEAQPFNQFLMDKSHPPFFVFLDEKLQKFNLISC